VTYVIGEAQAELAKLPAESIHCVVTSPPYWGLRDYGADGQLGLEPTPEAYVERLVGILAEARRVLRSDGTLWLNLGDSYVGSGGQGKEAGLTRHGHGHGHGHGQKHMAPGVRAMTEQRTGLKTKDLVGIPWRVAFALQADGWWLRSDIIWHKPNPMPESVTDRPTCAHEYMFLLSRAARYFYDADAVREDYSDKTAWTYAQPDKAARAGVTTNGTGASTLRTEGNNGRNKRTVWTIATRPYPEAHFATFPEQLVTPCILAGTSAKGCCSECGAPWVREVEKGDLVASGPNKLAMKPRSSDRHTYDEDIGARPLDGYGDLPRRERKTTGWAPQCHCNAAVVPCTVGDPFLGSGTVGAVAEALGRRWWGCELNPDYEPLIRRRTAQRGLFAR
jgi:DNA modification methylase